MDRAGFVLPVILGGHGLYAGERDQQTNQWPKTGETKVRPIGDLGDYPKLFRLEARPDAGFSSRIIFQRAHFLVEILFQLHNVGLFVNGLSS
jgi:hypothetical protein